MNDELGENCPFPLGGGIGVTTSPSEYPFLYIDFGREFVDVAKKFETYKKIFLEISQYDHFIINYTVHNEVPRIHGPEIATIKIGGTTHEIPVNHQFAVTLFPLRAPHVKFTNALQKTNGAWILIVYGSTSLRLAMNNAGDIIWRTEKERVQT